MKLFLTFFKNYFYYSKNNKINNFLFDNLINNNFLYKNLINNNLFYIINNNNLLYLNNYEKINKNLLDINNYLLDNILKDNNNNILKNNNNLLKNNNNNLLDNNNLLKNNNLSDINSKKKDKKKPSNFYSFNFFKIILGKPINYILLILIYFYFHLKNINCKIHFIDINHSEIETIENNFNRISHDFYRNS